MSAPDELLSRLDALAEKQITVTVARAEPMQEDEPEEAA